MNKVDLSSYNNEHYNPGNPVKRMLWYAVSLLVFQSYLFPGSTLKQLILRIFGARLGSGVIIKPSVLIKYPWFLEIGAHSWIGEKAWIDNLTMVKIGSHVCLSQGAMLLTGNHDYKKSGFDLEVQPITLGDGVWIGARAVVCPGVVCKSHAVLGVGSVATKELKEYTIYAGHPAVEIRARSIS